MIGKGRYSGCRMTVYGKILPGATSLVRWAKTLEALTPKARWRLKAIDWHRAHRKNKSLTARHFGLHRETIGIWYKRFQEQGVLGLNDQSRRPHHLRKPETSREIESTVVKIRKQYPAWSKYKLQPLVIRSMKQYVSPTTIGRILKRKGLIQEKISRKRQKAVRNPKRRFPRGLKITAVGDLIQIDTKHLTGIGGKKLYQFTAIDILSKLRVINVYRSESSKKGAAFLQECLESFPFPVKAVQTDNGAPFQKYFEIGCKERGLTHYFIYPRTPKQNSYVEIAHGADEREFYQQGNRASNLELMRKRVKAWEQTWNYIRPHQALNYLTPMQYLHKWQTSRLPTRDIITLQT